jgi:isopentenyl-diphosphate Delta-isomerase
MNNNSEYRKTDHLELARHAQTKASALDGRFDYEPLFFAHEKSHSLKQVFLGKEMNFPLWVSSMTGGAERAYGINQNLARLCGKYKLGMGLGSCRSLLQSRERLKDFMVRPLSDGPLFANLGLAQVEELVMSGSLERIHEVVKLLEADGLIIHLNPLQEWFQPEGDRYRQSPLQTLEIFLENTPYPVVVKEVGHGIGPRSLAALMKLPIAGIEFGAYGGTNFSLLESMRGPENELKRPFIHVGHTAQEMVEMVNALGTGDKSFIISGGIQSVLDAFELYHKLQAPRAIGMAQALLAPAMESFECLEKYFLNLQEAFLTAQGLLKLKETR